MVSLDKAIAIVVLMVSLNAGILVLSGLENFPEFQRDADGVADIFGLIPEGIQTDSIDTDNTQDSCFISRGTESDATLTGSDPTTIFGFLGTLSCVVGSFFGIMTVLFFGYAFAMAHMGLPPIIVFVVSIPLAILSLYAVAVILMAAIGVLTGRGGAA